MEKLARVKFSLRYAEITYLYDMYNSIVSGARMLQYRYYIIYNIIHIRFDVFIMDFYVFVRVLIGLKIKNKSLKHRIL